MSLLSIQLSSELTVDSLDNHPYPILYADVSFKISCSPDSPGLIKVNMEMRNLADLRRYGRDFHRIKYI